MPAYMNRRLALWIALIASCLGARAARAQSGGGQAEVTIGYQGLPYKATGESNTGIQVSEGVLLHVGAGAEAGYDTNVFYMNTAPISSALIRTSVFGDLSNATRTGAQSRVSFDVRAGVVYRRYQSDNPSVENFSNAWMPTAGLALSAGGGQFGFGLADTFARLEDPPYNAGQLVPITRYNNQASVEGRWAPGGGRITTMLRYTNMIDIFQGDYSFASTDANYLMLDASWKWLPKTAIFANAQQGYIFYLNEAEANANGKESSFPLIVTAGLRGLLTEKTSATVALGYTNGFYSGGFSTGGFWGSTYADASVTLRPTFLSRIVAGYRHDFQNAVVASFSYNETVYASYVQQIAGRLALDLSGRYSHRNYQGAFVDAGQMVTGRTDNFFQVGATLDYFVRNWVYFGVGYSMLSNSSNISDVEYLKQQMFVRLGLTY
jgi:hypothetical protein